jgi:hypothetical protein
MSHRSTSGCPKTSSRRRPDGDALAAPRRSLIPLTISNLKRTLRARNAGGRNAHRHIVSSRPRCRSGLAVIRRDGVPGARSGSDPNPNWTIGNAAAWATSAHHRPSAAALPPKTLHQVVCRAVSPFVPSGRRGVHAGAFPRRVLNRITRKGASVSLGAGRLLERGNDCRHHCLGPNGSIRRAGEADP